MSLSDTPRESRRRVLSYCLRVVMYDTPAYQLPRLVVRSLGAQLFAIVFGWLGEIHLTHPPLVVILASPDVVCPLL